MAAPVDVRQFVLAEQCRGRSVGFVPTMGALHAGHLSLVERSRLECNTTLVSIFVNPMQFGPHEDLAKYPQRLAQDLELLAPLGVAVVFAPTAEEMYPTGFATHVEVAGITDRWEGSFRLGHFRGVTTVVMKLFDIVPANKAYFGRKDYQQLLAVRRMARDMNVPIEIVACPIVRESDGLAMSSRNAYLSPDERRRAAILPRALARARIMFESGERNARRMQETLRQMIASENGVQLDYVAVVDPHALEELTDIEDSAVVLLAARVGTTRLIDNEVLGTIAE